MQEESGLTRSIDTGLMTQLDRRPTVERTYAAIDAMPGRLRGLMNRVMFSDEQMMQVYQAYRQVGEAAVVEWLERELDGQMPGWREWR